MISYNSFKAGLIFLGLSLFGCNDGYVGICGKVVEEQRARFKEICESRNDGNLHDGSLESVVKRRDELLRYNDCQLGCERWKCGQVKKESYEMTIKSLSTCGR